MLAETSALMQDPITPIKKMIETTGFRGLCRPQIVTTNWKISAMDNTNKDKDDRWKIST